MTTEEARLSTITIGGTEYQLRPPTDDDHSDREAWLEDGTVIEFWDDDIDAPGDDAECIRTYGVEAVTGIVDDEGRTTGFVCPSCEQAVLLHATEVYRYAYHACSTFGCDVVVACWGVLAGE